MLTFRQISTSPLEPYERGTATKYKTFRKLEDDYKQLKSHMSGIFDIHGIKESKTEEPYYVDVWCKIPSEPFPMRLDYDVVVRFHFKDKTSAKITPDTKVQVFSNSPSFMFTYAYVFNVKGSVIPDYKNSLSSRSLTEKPEKTNPKGLVGFEKSLFFTFLLLKDKGLFRDLKKFIQQNSIKLKPYTNFTLVTSEDKLRQYNLVKSHEKELYSQYKKRNSFGFF